MVEVVFIEVLIHPYALTPEALVVLRAWQGGEKEEFQDIEIML